MVYISSSSISLTVVNNPLSSSLWSISYILYFFCNNPVVETRANQSVVLELVRFDQWHGFPRNCFLYPAKSNHGSHRNKEERIVVLQFFCYLSTHQGMSEHVMPNQSNMADIPPYQRESLDFSDLQYRLNVCPKCHHIPYIMLYFWSEPYGPRGWS